MRFLADENFDNRILDALYKLLPDADIVCIQETVVFRAADPEILAWAAIEGRILLTQDVRTMTKFAYDRVGDGLPMPGVIEVAKLMPIGEAIEWLFVLIEAGIPEDFENQVRYIPLR